MRGIEVNRNKSGTAVPKGTRVHKQYDAMRDKGMPKGKAARIAQANTGQALATGKPPKRKGSSGKGRKR